MTDFTVYQGDSIREDFTAKDDFDVEVDLTGATVIWKVAVSTYSPTAILEKSTDDSPSGIAIVSAAGGTLRVTVDPAETASLQPGKYMQEVQVTTAAGLVFTVDRGTLTVLADLI